MIYLDLNFNRSTKNKAAVKAEFRKRFAPLCLRFELLFDDEALYEPDEMVLTEDTLLQTLLDGEGIYWDLTRSLDDTEVTGIVPYSTGLVLQNLHTRAKMLKDERLNDIFYDFKERQEWY